MTSKPVAAKTNDEAQIRQLNEDWRSALANRDLDKLAQHYSPDVLYFDAVPPYQHRPRCGRLPPHMGTNVAASPAAHQRRTTRPRNHD